MTYDYKQHCIKLLQILDTNWPLGLPTTWAKWADAVRADLAKPEPEGLTDEDLVKTVKQSMEDCIFISELLYYNREPLMQILRAVLARWGNHPGSPDRSLQPVPVSERLPGDELCWWYELDEDDGYGGTWTLLRIRGGTTRYSHWLPAHALPRPS